MALIPTRKIPQLTAYGVPLAGPEMLEIWATGVSRRITARDFALPIDALLTAVNSSSTLPGSRYLTQGIGIVLTDGGPGQPLRIDASGAVAGPANPTAQVGLAAVNGALVTYMRSDAAPALSQAIAPTWTAQHIFALDGATNAAVMLASNRPQLDWNELDAAANNRRWRMEAVSETFAGEVVNDANNSVTIWLAVDRTLNVVDSINLLATAVQVNGQSVRDAAILTSGTVNTARLGSGVADATSWLRGDSTWQVLPGGFTGFANPTASLGLAAINGAATTAMRSDAAPALSQGIAPTWTAQHIFSLSGATNAAILLSSVQPQLDWNETDGAANNRRWREGVNGEQFAYQVVNDANSAAVTWMAVDRTLNVVDSIALTSTALTWNGNPISTAIGANPTGTVGLAAVNGAATTFLRSDGAPALSQAIVPTWTGIHTWSLAAPILTLSATGAALNAKSTLIRNPNGGLAISSALDASPNTAVDNVFLAGRTAVAWTSLAFGNVADNPTYTFLGTGLATFNGPMSVTVAGTNAIPMVLLTSTRPLLMMNETDAAANNRRWGITTEAEQLQLYVINDANTVAANWLSVDRTGAVVDNVAFPTQTIGSFIVGGTTATVIGAAAGTFNFNAGANQGLYLIAGSAAANSMILWNQAAAGDNLFITFGTEAAFSGRGSITYNRAGGLTAYNTTSDARRKTNIRDSESASNILDAIRIRAFDWKETGNHLEHWVVAQELHEIVPYAVSVGDEKHDWGVDATALVPLLVKEIQDLRKRVAFLEH